MLIFALLNCASTKKSSSAGEYADDSAITTKVKSMLAEDEGLKTYKITVETYKGVVQLRGITDSQENKDRAGEIARSVKGVVDVKNDLIIDQKNR
jgi:osmotically-inducible protein OsmY